MTFIACQKNEIIEFEYDITLEDYYSKQPLNDVMVVLKYCESAGFVSGRSPCDSVDYDVTSVNGAVEFSGEYERSYGRGHEFFVIGNDGYPKTLDIRIVRFEPKVVSLKPFVQTEFIFTSSKDIDSLFIWISASGYQTVWKNTHTNDSLKINIPTIPDEENQIGFRAYYNNSYKGSKTLYFTPTFNGNNALNHDFD